MRLTYPTRWAFIVGIGNVLIETAPAAARLVISIPHVTTTERKVTTSFASFQVAISTNLTTYLLRVKRLLAEGKDDLLSSYRRVTCGIQHRNKVF